MSALTVDLNARIAQFETEMKKAMSTLDKFSKKGDDTASLLRTAFKSIGGAYIAKELVQFAKSGIDAADSLNDMSVRLGVTVKDLASMQLIAEQSGSSLEGIGVGIAKLNKSASEAAGGNDKLAAALLSLGVTASTPLERFYQLADAVQGMEDPTKRAADLSAVLGKQYLDLVPTLVQGGDALRASAKASESFADAMAKLAPNADAFNDNLALLKQNAAGAAAGLLGELVPAMNAVIASARQAQLLGENGFNFVQLLGLGVVSLHSPAEQLKDVNDQIRITSKELSTMKGGVLDIFGDKAAMEAKLSELKRLRALLQNQVVTGIQTPVASNRAPSGGDTGAQMACIAKGGTWDGGKCIPKKTGKAVKTIDKLDVFNDEMARNAKLIADETDRIAGDLAFMVDVDLAQNNPIAAMAQEWKEAGAALHDSVKTPLEELEDRLAYIDELMRLNVISVEDYGRAYAKALDEGNDKAEKTKSIAEELGLTFESAFENAIAGGKKFSDVLKGLAQDMLKIFARKAITEPLANWAAGLFAPSANGNVFSSPALSAYSGSVVSKPTVFPFANGIGLMGEAGAEAILPLKRGRNGKLGVSMDGGGGVVVQNTYNIDARGAEAGVEQRIRRAIDESEDRAVQRSVTQVQSMNQRGQLRLA